MPSYRSPAQVSRTNVIAKREAATQLQSKNRTDHPNAFARGPRVAESAHDTEASGTDTGRLSALAINQPDIPTIRSTLH